MDTNAIINAAMQQLVTTVADEVIRRLKAETVATATLEPEQLQFAMLHLLESDTLIREEVLNISEQKFNEIDARLDHIENDDGPSRNVTSATTTTSQTLSPPLTTWPASWRTSSPPLTT